MVANGLIVRSKSRLQSLFIQLAAKFEVDLPVYEEKMMLPMELMQ